MPRPTSLSLALLALAGAASLAQAPAQAQSGPAPVSPPAGPPAARLPGAPPVPQGWTMTIGVGALAGTAWQGSRDGALAIIPDLRVNYRDRLFASVPEGIGWNAVNTRQWKAGPLLKPRFGRDADKGGSPFQVAGGSTALRGMGNVGLAGEAGGFVEARFGAAGQWRARGELRQGFGGHSGLVGDVSLVRAGRAGRMIYSVGPRASFASRDFMQTYFGVDPAQAARTGLAVSRPGGGLVSWGLGGSAIHPLDRRRSVALVGGIDRLGDGPAGTSLIRQRGQRTSYGAALVYAFRFGL